MLSHLSFSSISAFRACPLSWYAKYLLKESAPTTDAAQRGSQTDTLIAHRLGCGAAPTEPLIDRVEEATDHYLANGGWTRADEAQKPIEITPNAWDIFRSLYEVDYALPLKIIGYIDLARRCDNGIQTEIADIKTSERADYRPDWSLQLALYSLVERAVKFEVHLLTYTKQIKLHKYEYRPTDATYRWAMNVIGYNANAMMAVAATKAADKIPATPGFQCRWCPRAVGNCEAALIGSLTAVQA